MKQRTHNDKGVTLVELMAVIAIIGLLAGVAAFFVSGNREVRAQTELVNDIVSLLNEQRTRAATMNVASYVRFSADNRSMYVEPRLGRTSACIGDIDEQIPIMYDIQTSIASMDGDTNGDIVRIDLTDTSLAGSTNHQSVRCNADYITGQDLDGHDISKRRFCRTLDSVNDTKFSGRLKLSLSSKKLNGSAANAISGNHLTVCFQPNGQAFFIDDAGWRDDISVANIEVGVVNISGDPLTVYVSNLGMIYSSKR